MSQPLMVRIGADVAPAARSIAAAAVNIGTNLAITSRAAVAAGQNLRDLTALGVRAGDNLRSLGSAIPAPALTAARAIGTLAVAHKLAIGTMAAYGAAAAAGAAELEKFQQIAEKAAASNVGTTYFQAFTAGADAFKLKVQDLERDLSSLEKNTRDRFNADGPSDTSNRARDLLAERFRGTADFGQSNSVTMFDQARSTEERIRAVLTGLADMEAAGHRVAAIDLARKLGMNQLAEQVETARASFNGFLAETDRLAATGIRDGSIISPQLITRASELKTAWEKNTRELQDNLRPILDECARLALIIGENANWTAGIFNKLVGVVGSLVGLLRQAANTAIQIPASVSARVDSDDIRAQLDEEISRLNAMPRPRFGPDALAAQREAAEVKIAQLRGQLAAIAGAATSETRAAALSGLPDRVRPTDFDALLPPRDPRGADGRARASRDTSSSSSAADTTDKRLDAITKFIANQEKANELLRAELATVGQTSAVREQATQIAKAEAEARAQGGRLTDDERSKILALAEAHGRLRDSIKEVEAQQKKLADAFQYAGDRLVDMAFNGRDLQSVLKGLWTEIGRAAITGQGPLAGLLGMSPAAGAPAGTMGGLMGLLQGSAGSAGAGGRQQASPLGGGLLQLLQGLFGMFMGGAGGGGAMSPFGLFHGGGVVGDGRISGYAPAGLWAGAPRMHSGGVLGGHERPIIAEMGEEILSRRQRGMVAQAMAVQGAAAPRPVNVNITNTSGAQVTAQQNESGGIDVMVEMVESRLGGRVAAGRGPLAGGISAATGSESNRNMNG